MAGFLDIDLSEILELVHILEAAADAPRREAETAHREVGQEVLDEARSTAGSYPNGTGALAADVRMASSRDGTRIFSDKREGFFLEFGSPNTGAPRPWLTEPARKGAEKLGERLTKAIDLW